jgi:Tol biopolymer transport system component
MFAHWSSSLALVAVLGTLVHAQTTSRVSVSTNGAQGLNASFDPAISGDGRFVVFTSDASNLFAADGNGSQDVLVHNLVVGTTTCASVDATGTQGSFNNFVPAVSRDGRYVAFESESDNLVLGDTNGRNDAFVRDRQTGLTTRVSVDSSGVQGNKDSGTPAISADGRFVAFMSDATNLVVGDTNARTDVFVHDSQTGQTVRVSVDSAGVQGNNHSVQPVISPDGRFVAFSSTANNFAAGDTNSYYDVFMHDLQTSQTTCVSVNAAGIPSGGTQPSISSDGHFVSYSGFGVVVRDTQNGVTVRVDVNSAGVPGNQGGATPSISPDGRWVAFSSSSSNLVSGDTNGLADVFARERGLDRNAGQR